MDRDESEGRKANLPKEWTWSAGSIEFAPRIVKQKEDGKPLPFLPFPSQTGRKSFGNSVLLFIMHLPQLVPEILLKLENKLSRVPHNNI